MAAIARMACVSARLCRTLVSAQVSGSVEGTRSVFLSGSGSRQWLTCSRISSSVPRRSFHPGQVLCGELNKTELGSFESLEYRIFLEDVSGTKISPWHDIPLEAGNGLFNMVCEIPKNTKAKMEIATDESTTPIKQDTKKGKLRYYPYNILWNYGLLPQTWEDPTFANPEVENCFGDNDPVDVVDISDQVAEMGEVYPVKPLGVLAMIDDGELDWKIIAIRADDPKAKLVNDVEDVEKEFPGTVTAIRDWFRDYKIPDGKPANRFGLNNEAANRAYALKVIEETHESWSKLVRRKTPKGELSLV